MSISRVRKATSTSRRVTASLTLAVAALVATLALAGCGASVPDILVKEAGAHGDQLEKVYKLYNKDVLAKASTRDLKDINAALKANDLKKATAGDVRRAQTAIQSRIDKLHKYVTEIKAANGKLKRTPLPSFAAGLDDEFAHKEFDGAYRGTTTNIQRYTTADLNGAKLAFSSLEKYLDFLEQWEEYLTDDDIAGLVSTGTASDKAYARFNKLSKRLDRREKLSAKIKPLVDRMASASSDSSQLTTLIDEMKKQYPKSFLAVHIVEKK